MNHNYEYDNQNNINDDHQYDHDKNDQYYSKNRNDIQKNNESNQYNRNKDNNGSNENKIYDRFRLSQSTPASIQNVIKSKSFQV
jgi:hypothetical protein